MMMMPLALKPTTILRGNKLSETAMSSKGYLDVPLTIEVDPNLRGAHQYPDTIHEDIQCPPGISTLRQWGQTKIPSRKHAGKSFEEAHADLGYVHQIWNRRAVSAWLRSFQMYCRMRQHADPGPTSTTAEITQKPMPINSGKPAAAAMAAPKSEIKTTEPKVSLQVTCQEWTHVEKGKTIHQCRAQPETEAWQPVQLR